jgi:hypothetical protein
MERTFNRKEVEDSDTRRQVVIQVMGLIKECDKLNDSKQK